MNALRAVLVATVLFATAAQAEAYSCAVGLHVISLSQINIAERSAFVDLYWWMICPAGTKEDAMSLALITASSHEVADTLREDIEGRVFQSQRVRAQLRVPLSLAKYPFDRQRIVIDFESPWAIPDQRLQLDTTDAPLVARPVCCLDREVNLPDWKLDSVTATVDTHEYATAFGWPQPNPDAKKFDRFRVEVVAHREVLPYVVKYLLPLLIILGVSFARCFWGPDQLDASTAVVATSLLAVVALHLAHATGLPEVGYLVTGDLFFLHSELVLVVMLVMTVIENRLATTERGASAERLLRWERLFIPALVALGWGGILAASL